MSTQNSNRSLYRHGGKQSHNWRCLLTDPEQDVVQACFENKCQKIKEGALRLFEGKRLAASYSITDGLWNSCEKRERQEVAR